MEFVRATVELASVTAPITVPILLLVLRSAAVVAFFPQFRDFRAGLGSADLLPNFSFYSWATLLVLPFLLRLSFSSSLSPKVASLGCFTCRPPSLVVPVYLFGVSFCNSGAVSSSSPPAGGGVGSC